MRTIEIITLKAAYDFTKGSSRFVNLRDLQELCLPKTAAKQHWTYHGDWRRVQPYYNAVTRTEGQAQ